MCCHKLRGVFCPVRAETAFPTCLLVRKCCLSCCKFEAFSRRQKGCRSIRFSDLRIISQVKDLLVRKCCLRCRKFEAFSRREKRMPKHPLFRLANYITSVTIQPQSASKIQNQLFSPPIGLPPPTILITVVPKLSPT